MTLDVLAVLGLPAVSTSICSSNLSGVSDNQDDSGNFALSFCGNSGRSFESGTVSTTLIIDDRVDLVFGRYAWTGDNCCCSCCNAENSVGAVMLIISFMPCDFRLRSFSNPNRVFMLIFEKRQFRAWEFGRFRM